MHAIKSTIITGAVAAAALLAGGCASPGQYLTPTTGIQALAANARYVPVEVRNPAPEQVTVYFVYDNGMKQRIGEVPGGGSMTFLSRMSLDRPGRFYAHRMGESDQGALLSGEADPMMMNGKVVLALGMTRDLDRWFLLPPAPLGR